MILALTGCVLGSLALLSLGEYVAHRWLMHSRKTAPASTFEQHVRLHHGRFYRGFEGDRDQAARHVGVLLSPAFTLAASCWVWLPALLVWWPAGVASALVFALEGVVWSAVHLEMHEPRGRWFARTRLYRFWAAWHRRHHERPSTNYGVLLGMPFDFLLGTYGGLSHARQ